MFPADQTDHRRLNRISACIGEISGKEYVRYVSRRSKRSPQIKPFFCVHRRNQREKNMCDMFPADQTDHRRLNRISAGVGEISGKKEYVRYVSRRSNRLPQIKSYFYVHWRNRREKNMCDMFPADQKDHRRLSRFSACIGEISGKKNVRYVSGRSKRSPQIKSYFCGRRRNRREKNMCGMFPADQKDHRRLTRISACIGEISGKKNVRYVSRRSKRSPEINSYFCVHRRNQREKNMCDMFPADQKDHRRLTRISAGIGEISGKKNMCDMFPADQKDHRRLTRISACIGEISGKKNMCDMFPADQKDHRRLTVFLRASAKSAGKRM
ncbi:hypothetical protein [Pedobacter psychrodurus]|uniref:hypothetical protein n=1 Tax=Pedobacter psychrodurus TaxID=2530456 RepID=UPI002931801E|nr:hypothetical protein [Pedobacter psychrodurus]